MGRGRRIGAGPEVLVDARGDDSRVRRRILIVDDHADFRAWARALLELQGYAVVGEAADGRSAIAAVRALRPEVVLLDIRLPDMDGFEVTRRMSREGSTSAIVLVSSRDATDYGRQLAASGALGFIAKAELSASTLEAVLGGESR
jgi:DNA-binding NarL/FixJ family response regulator